MSKRANITIEGNLTKDPELRQTTNGTSVASFTLAVGDTVKDKDGNYPTEYFDVVAFGKSAENIAKFCRKGREVFVIGTPSFNRYTDRDGKERNYFRIVLRDYVLGRDPNKTYQAPSKPVYNGDVPERGGNLEDIDVKDDDLPF